ncbi:uncharacterized protein LOC118439130 [Folsomia candida]|uniref:uncharacterized protein LOC118439130 n=1 Tax=Folsomia candida TaxID=158441 RepID=UPI001605144C|nr:uncharacterized protein LOC118439130 [Folsomia candida]
MLLCRSGNTCHWNFQHWLRYICLASGHIFLSAVLVIFASLLVHGYTRRNYRYLLPWLFCNYVSLVLIVVWIVLICAIYAIALELQLVLFILVVCSVLLGIETYCVFVVKAFEDELRAGEPSRTSL